ncbi:MAG: hypothetical protein SNJ53_03320 [Thermodesulfovibrionales bacterium]
MKRGIISVFIVLLFALSILSGCGGGGVGTADVPFGVNPSIPSSIRLDASTYAASTNASVALFARVLDGNGLPVAGIPVTFTNLSSVGVFTSERSGLLLIDKMQKSTVVTDSNGIARVSIFSSNSGWATILAQVSGYNHVRDRKLIYFSTSDFTPSLLPTISLDVECVLITNNTCTGNAYVLFENDHDSRVAITATVKDEYGSLAIAAPLTWSTSHTTEVTFERQDTITNTSGKGTAIVNVNPSILRSIDTYVNIMVTSSIVNQNGIAISPMGIVSLLLKPVVVDTTISTLTATNTYVNTGGTTTIIADIKSSIGQPVPNGTPVDFSTTCGSLNPLSTTTTNGRATTTFTAPQTTPTGGKCTVTAKVAGTTIGSIDINITQTLAVSPSSMTLSELQTATFTIYGGVPPYAVASRHDNVTVTPTTVSTSGGTFTATPSASFCTPVAPATTCTGTAVIEVRDTAGTTVTVTLTVNGT